MIGFLAFLILIGFFIALGATGWGEECDPVPAVVVEPPYTDPADGCLKAVIELAGRPNPRDRRIAHCTSKTFTVGSRVIAYEPWELRRVRAADDPLTLWIRWQACMVGPAGL